MEKKNTKRKVTLFLDTNTLTILEKISSSNDGSTNKSSAVRFLAKEYERKTQKTTKPI